MSWTSISSIIKPLQQWYSEINSATLTGAIDVVVVEHEDGSFVSSPFHVRFGKLGVLKAREKIVDIEVNDEPVNIHMKLDEFGAAFFVEGLSDSEEEDFPPELATSPIPGSDPERRSSEEKDLSTVNRSLINEFDSLDKAVSEDIVNSEDVSPEKEAASTGMFAPSGHKGKLNRKKRKRRQNMRHSRNSSRSSLKDLMGQHQDDNDSSESSDGITRKTSITASSADGMEGGNDENDGDDENDTPVNSLVSASTPLVKAVSETRLLPPPAVPPSTPQHHGLGSGNLETSQNSAMTQSFMSQKSDENSLLLSRLGGESINSILDSQERLMQKNIAGVAVQDEVDGGGSAPGTMNYFSEPEMSPVTSPIGSRPGTPNVLSDTEYETKRQPSTSDTEQSWEWGKLPSTSSQVPPENENQQEGKDGEGGISNEEVGKKDLKRYRSWTFSLWSKPKNEEEGAKPINKNDAPGVYLDDIKDDQEMLSIYVGSHREHSANQLLHVDDDAESGNGPSLPMSPHSVEGAIGGTRIRYDSSDDEHKNLIPKLLPDMAISLCGGLENDKDDTFSPALFEQGLISFDDFEMHLRNPSTAAHKDLFSNPDLVVRIGEQYYRWPDAVPVVMSVVLYGRPLPPELADKGAKVVPLPPTKPESAEKDGVGVSPNSKKASSSWWPFGSSRREAEQQQQEQQLEDAKPGEGETTTPAATNQEDNNNKAVKFETGPPKEESLEATKDDEKEKVDILMKADQVTPKKRNDSSEGESDPDLQALSEGIKSRKFKKSLRLSSEDIKRLNLKPGVNEVQFSVTTAYQGTSRCRCHVYWWKSTDKVVISDIDGTITKSDVLGHVLPIIGRDWAQSGVASLFTKIVDNGYHIAYLSARAIGQAGITKDYLKSISQGDVSLPDGPIFLNPTSLVNAFHREVIEKKPEKFKIACLRDIQKLFPSNKNPFYAGYGNRVNDVFAYRTVGIPLSRIFTINTKGELRHELTQTFQTSYDSLSSIVDHVFPPVAYDAESPAYQQEYSSFAFWREPIPILMEEEDSNKEEVNKDPIAPEGRSRNSSGGREGTPDAKLPSSG